MTNLIEPYSVIDLGKCILMMCIGLGVVIHGFNVFDFSIHKETNVFHKKDEKQKGK